MEFVSIAAPPKLQQLEKALENQLHDMQNWQPSNYTTWLDWLATGGRLFIFILSAGFLIRYWIRSRNNNEEIHPETTWPAKWFAATAQHTEQVSINI